MAVTSNARESTNQRLPRRAADADGLQGDYRMLLAAIYPAGARASTGWLARPQAILSKSFLDVSIDPANSRRPVHRHSSARCSACQIPLTKVFHGTDHRQHGFTLQGGQIMIAFGCVLTGLFFQQATKPINKTHCSDAACQFHMC